MTELTDRELLELAAKAAGIELEWNDHGAPGYWGEWRGLPQWQEWNAAEDDGDALRLSVALRMEIAHNPPWSEKHGDLWVRASTPTGSGSASVSLAAESERGQATRRAIVTAAAKHQQREDAAAERSIPDRPTPNLPLGAQAAVTAARKENRGERTDEEVHRHAAACVATPTG